MEDQIDATAALSIAPMEELALPALEPAELQSEPRLAYPRVDPEARAQYEPAADVLNVPIVRPYSMMEYLESAACLKAVERAGGLDGAFAITRDEAGRVLLHNAVAKEVRAGLEALRQRIAGWTQVENSLRQMRRKPRRFFRLKWVQDVERTCPAYDGEPLWICTGSRQYRVHPEFWSTLLLNHGDRMAQTAPALAGEEAEVDSGNSTNERNVAESSERKVVVVKKAIETPKKAKPKQDHRERVRAIEEEDEVEEVEDDDDKCKKSKKNKRKAAPRTPSPAASDTESDAEMRNPGKRQHPFKPSRRQVEEIVGDYIPMLYTLDAVRRRIIGKARRLQLPNVAVDRVLAEITEKMFARKQ